MSYQVLARKWRPRVFREMVGQEHVLQALINALDHNRLHHAYLFTGTRGVGKTTIARILAKCLNCETGVSSEPCGQCAACREIAEGRFVDLIEVDAASRTRVEDTRELLENVQYAPTRGRYKVYLIDEVHMLSTHSFNALLKTLEEPPPHVKFLLATTDPQKLPVTILSRCLQFNLKNMNPERIVQHLEYVLEQELVPFETAALWQLGRSADGSMRDAMSLTDQAIAYGSGRITEAEVRTMLGTIDQAAVYNLLNALAALDGKALLTEVERMSEHAPDYASALAELLSILHRVAIAQALPEAVDNSLGDRDRVMHLAQALPSEDVQLFYQTGLLGRRDLPLAPDPRAGFEMVLLRMLAFKPQGVPELPGASLPAGQRQPVAAATPPLSPPTAPPISAGVGVAAVDTAAVGTAPVATATDMVAAGARADTLAGANPGAGATVGNPVAATGHGTVDTEEAAVTSGSGAVGTTAVGTAPAATGTDSSAGAFGTGSAATATATATATRDAGLAPQSFQAQPDPARLATTDSPHQAAAAPAAPAAPASEVRQSPASRAAPVGAAAAAVNLSQLPREQRPPFDGPYDNADYAADDDYAEYAASSPWLEVPETVQAGTGGGDFSAKKSEPAVPAPVSSGAETVAPVDPAPGDSQPLSDIRIPLEQVSADNWLALYPGLGVTGLLQSTAANCQLLRRDGNHFFFTLDQDNSTLYDDSHQQRLAALMSDYFAQPVRVTIQPGPVTAETPAAMVLRIRQERQQQAVDTIKNDPVVLKLMEHFDAQLREDSIQPL